MKNVIEHPDAMTVGVRATREALEIVHLAPADRDREARRRRSRHRREAIRSGLGDLCATLEADEFHRELLIRIEEIAEAMSDGRSGEVLSFTALKARRRPAIRSATGGWPGGDAA